MTTLNDVELVVIDDDEPASVTSEEDNIGMTDEEIAAFFADSLIAAGYDSDTHTLGMIALVPTREHAQRLVVEGGLSTEELHTTLYFLGKADQYNTAVREEILAQMWDVADKYGTVRGKGFSISVFNPTTDDACVVVLVSGTPLGLIQEDAKFAVLNGVRNIMGHTNVLSEQHVPWIPHVTLTYDKNMGLVKQLRDRVGDIEYDRLCVVFGNEKVEIPLGSSLTAGGFNPLEHPRDPSDGQFTDKPGGSVAKALKKAIPAIIYKKHDDNTTVAMSPSGDKRIRWSAGDKKYIQESRKDSSWKTDKSLTKTEAYNDLKVADKWVEPHKASGDDNTPKAPVDVVKKAVTPPKKIEAPKAESPKVETPKLTGDVAQKRARIKEIDSWLDELADDARPHEAVEAEVTHKAGIGKVLTPHDLAESAAARKALAQLTVEGRELADEQFALRMELDGSVFGGDDVNAERWKNATIGDQVRTILYASANKAKLEKQGDQYRINDKMTIENNRELRSGNPSQKAKAWRGRMVNLIKAQTMADDSVVFRGAALRPETIMKLKPGSIMVDKGTMSTSSRKSDSEFYTKARADGLPGTLPVMFEMRVPKGHNIGDVEYSEFVLAPDLPVKIVSVEKQDNGFIRIITEMA